LQAHPGGRFLDYFDRAGSLIGPYPLRRDHIRKPSDFAGQFVNESEPHLLKSSLVDLVWGLDVLRPRETAR
jgi:hypothetical protein